MFKKRKKRSSNPLFGLFRLLLSMIMLTALLGGIYSAYKHFSGVDPLKLSPKSITETVLGLVSQPKIIQDIQDKVSSKVLGKATKAPQEEEYKLSNLDIKKDPTPTPVKTRGKQVLRFALLADSHNDSTDLKKALDQIKKDYGDIKFIVGLGDYTDVGTLGELKAAKTLLDGSGFRYFVTAGDHDLWDSRNKDLKPETNFVSTFGPVYQSFTQDYFKFIILYNSDNYIGLGDTQKQWLSDQLSGKDTSGTFVFLHEPLFHPSSDHFMGRVEPKLKTEARDLISQLSKAGVKKVFAGDAHYFSEYEEPESKLSMVTIGAVTLERNLQNPRFGIVSVYEDGSSEVEDVEIK